MSTIDPADVNDVTDYIIDRLQNAGTPLNVLKLHKLLYYVQAWHLAFYGKRAFDESFQAWVHGPVSRKIYDRFKDQKSLYSTVSEKDIRNKKVGEKLPKLIREHINVTLEAYAAFYDTQLEQMTHREKPWIEARKSYEPGDRCEVQISDATMQTYYSARTKKSRVSS